MYNIVQKHVDKHFEYPFAVKIKSLDKKVKKLPQAGFKLGAQL